MSDDLLLERDGRTAILTLNRPQQRNALSTALLRGLRETMAALDGDDDVDVVVLTGADPAFCAGLDLNELGSTGGNLGAGSPRLDDSGPTPASPWARMSKPVIAAVNGAAVTGGLELVLHCDLVIASERARFGDTHARVGVMPGWGLSVLLPQAVGVRKAKEMSLTGNFLSAHDALRCGLANHVVAPEELLPTALRIAADICGNDQRGVRALLDEYKQTTATTVADGLRIEARLAADQHTGVDPEEVERRRQAIIDRGRSQV